MPYNVFKIGNQWCVYKVTEDDKSKRVRRIACHDTEEKANKQVIALRIAESERNQNRSRRRL